NIFWKDVQDGVLRAQLIDWDCLGTGRSSQLDAGSGSADVDGCQPEEDRDCSDDLEINDGAQTETADLPQVGVAGDTHYQRAEDQRRDDGFDQAKKNKRENSQVGGGVGKIVPDGRAQQHGDEDPRSQGAPQAAIDHESGKRDPAQYGDEYCRLSSEAPAQQGSQRNDGCGQQRDVLSWFGGSNHRVAVRGKSGAEGPLFLPQNIFQFHTPVGALIAIFHNHGGVERQSPLHGFALGNSARTGHDHSALRHAQRFRG